MVAVSKICVDFRKETGVMFSSWVTLALRKENAFFGKCFISDRKQKERDYYEEQ